MFFFKKWSENWALVAGVDFVERAFGVFMARSSDVVSKGKSDCLKSDRFPVANQWGRLLVGSVLCPYCVILSQEHHKIIPQLSLNCCVSQ